MSVGVRLFEMSGRWNRMTDRAVTIGIIWVKPVDDHSGAYADHSSLQNRVRSIRTRLPRTGVKGCGLIP